MKVTLPADAQSAITQVGGIAALLDKNGWQAAAFIAVSVQPGAGQGGGTSARSCRRLSANAFAKTLPKGWNRNVVMQHWYAWEAAADRGVVDHAADLTYGDTIAVPDNDWQDYYASGVRAEDNAAAVAVAMSTRKPRQSIAALAAELTTALPVHYAPDTSLIDMLTEMIAEVDEWVIGGSDEAEVVRLLDEFVDAINRFRALVVSLGVQP